MGRLRTNVDAPKLITKFKNYMNLERFTIPKSRLFLEIGSGKGDFLIKRAIANPKAYFLGIEKYATVILKALKKIERKNLKIANLSFSCSDANSINIKKFKNKINKIYLNFSDPWPKKRHEKRRLTSTQFLNMYKRILKKEGIVEFKTDNDNFYKYTLGMLKSRKDIVVLYKTKNLYKNLLNKFNKDNIQTEYEKKFVKLNKNINKIVWRYRQHDKNS